MKTKIFILLALCLLLTGCGKSEAVLDVEEQISLIGTVSIQSIDIIESAEAAYAALSSEEKEDVSNYEMLEDARHECDALVEQRNKEQVSNVEGMIDNLTNVTLDSKSNIEAARKAYDELDASLQAQVINAESLFDAEDRIKLLEKITIKNFKRISCSKANLFKDTSFSTWFNDDDASATMAFCFHLQGSADGWLDLSNISMSDMIICQIKADRRYDLLLPSNNDSVFYIQYWPENKTAQMGTKTLSTSVSKYAELLKDAGVIENYKEISLSSYINVMNAAR